jgi:hypothetical protein
VFSSGEKVRVKTFSGIKDGIVHKDDGGSHIVVVIKKGKKLIRRGKVMEVRSLCRGELTGRPTVAVIKEEHRFVSCPKTPPARDGTYLEFIREHPCCACHSNKRSEPHHWSPKGRGGGMGAKCSDYRTVPLCRVCHDHFHSTGSLPGESPESTREIFSLFQLDYMIEWIERKKG